MLNRVLPTVLTVMALLLLVGIPLTAGEKTDTHTGIVVKAIDGKLTMTDKNGKNQHTHMVADNAKIICDGKACELTDLRKGFEVTVTTDKQGDRTVATRIVAKKKDS